MNTKNKTSLSLSQILRMFLSVLFFCLSLTVLFLSMRAVLNIGGFCAEGGPYEIAVHCPKGIPVLASVSPLLMIASIFVYISAAESYVTGVFLFWSGIFLSLGWNFLEFALYPPQGEGIVYGWLVCGIMFGLMGIGPFIYVVKGFLQGLSGRAVILPGERGPDLRIFLLDLAGIALGIWAGISLFNSRTL